MSVEREREREEEEGGKEGGGGRVGRGEDGNYLCTTIMYVVVILRERS